MLKGLPQIDQFRNLKKAKGFYWKSIDKHTKIFDCGFMDIFPEVSSKYRLILVKGKKMKKTINHHLTDMVRAFALIPIATTINQHLDSGTNFINGIVGRFTDTVTPDTTMGVIP